MWSYAPISLRKEHLLKLLELFSTGDLPTFPDLLIYSIIYLCKCKLTNTKFIVRIKIQYYSILLLIIYSGLAIDQSPCWLLNPSDIPPSGRQFIYFWTLLYFLVIQDAPSSSFIFLSVWESAIFLRSTYSFCWIMELETKICVLCVLIVIGVSLLLGFPIWKSNEIHEWVLICTYIHVYKFSPFMHQ